MTTEIQQELEKIKSGKSRFTCEQVIEWARKHPKSALHASFEWDDIKGAEQWRIAQARRLIAIHITNAVGTRRVVSLSIDRYKGGGYRDTNTVLNDQDLREIMVSDAIADFLRLAKRWEHLPELTAIVAEIRKRAQAVENVA